jgi:hypothetical protein
METKSSAPQTPVDIAADIAKIQALIASWKTAPATGQLHIAIGALGTAVEFAAHHLGLPKAEPKG